MRNDFGTRPYSSRFPYSKGTKGKRVKAKHGGSSGKWSTSKKNWKKA